MYFTGSQGWLESPSSPVKRHRNMDSTHDRKVCECSARNNDLFLNLRTMLTEFKQCPSLLDIEDTKSNLPMFLGEMNTIHFFLNRQNREESKSRSGCMSQPLSSLPANPFPHEEESHRLSLTLKSMYNRRSSWYVLA